MDVEEVNKMGYAEFISAFRGVLEHGAIAAATVWGARPFPSSAALQEAFLLFLRRLDPEAKKGVVRCHPDLAGKLAREGDNHDLLLHTLLKLLRTDRYRSTLRLLVS